MKVIFTLGAWQVNVWSIQFPKVNTAECDAQCHKSAFSQNFKNPPLPFADTSHCANLGQILVCRRTGPLQTSTDLRHKEQASSFPLVSAYIPRQCRYCNRRERDRESRFQVPPFSPGAPGSSNHTTGKEGCVERVGGPLAHWTVRRRTDGRVNALGKLCAHPRTQTRFRLQYPSFKTKELFVSRKISDLQGVLANTKQSHRIEGKRHRLPCPRQCSIESQDKSGLATGTPSH